MRAVWFLGGAAFRGFRRAPLLFLVAVVVVLAVVQGWFEPWEPAVCEDSPQLEACQ